MRKRQAMLLLFCVILLLSGLGLLLYPSVNAWLEEGRIHQNVEDFRAAVDWAAVDIAQRPTSPDTSITEPTEGVTIPYSELFEAMEEYNTSIYRNGQAELCDPWAYQAPVFDLAEFGIEDGVVGILSIPKMDLELPIYLGATSEHLSSGAAQLSQTSMPIGGTNTNCVLAGHRGWYGALFFRHIELLEIGDEVSITNLRETLTYQVVEIKVIEPNDIDQILIQPGRDLVTLLTCHPYGSGGRYRYVVYCERNEP